jgi:hypothetical protein
MPRYTAGHTVVLEHPVSTTFPRLGRGDTMEASVRLSNLVSRFDLIKSDTVAIPSTLHLSEASVRTLPGSANAAAGERLLPRQFFHLEETIPVVFGLIKQTVKINGTLTWDEDAKVALYESLEESQGILTWKLREFEEFEEEGVVKTRVKESIQGHAPKLLKGIVEKTTRESHTYALSSSYSEFERPTDLGVGHIWRNTTHCSNSAERMRMRYLDHLLLLLTYLIRTLVAHSVSWRDKALQISCEHVCQGQLCLASICV